MRLPVKFFTRVFTFTREPVWSQNQNFILPEKLKILRVFLLEDFKKRENGFSPPINPSLAGPATTKSGSQITNNFIASAAHLMPNVKTFFIILFFVSLTLVDFESLLFIRLAYYDQNIG